MSQTVASPSRSRIDLIDVARGLALLAMFVFHFAYDLSYFGLIETDIPVDPAWRWFARCIAGSFLTIVGFSLVLATRKGLNRKAYARRLAMVAGAAALVTLATRFAMPDSYIFFGILHQIALASVLALPFLRLPAPVLIVSAAVAFALPFFVAHPWLDHDWLLWLGLARIPISTADFVPVFPWFGCVLAGMALAKIILPLGGRWQDWQARILPTRILAWGGRHSLAVYLIHQPIFIGALMLALQVVPVSAPQERGFVLTCQRSCTDAGTDPPICTNVCACAVEALKQENLWSKALTDTLSTPETERTREIARGCYRDQQ